MIEVLVLLWISIGIGAGVHMGIGKNPLTKRGLNDDPHLPGIAFVGIFAGPLTWIYILIENNKVLEKVTNNKYLSEDEQNILDYLGISDETNKAQ